MGQEIVDGKVVITTEVELTEFIQQKQQELEMIAQQIQSLTLQQSSILNELQQLINK